MPRLILINLFFLTSLLAIFKAPTYHLWLLAVFVTEFPLIFIGITILLTVWGVWLPKYQLAGTLLGVAAVLLFLSTIVRTYAVASSLKSGLTAAFGKDNNDNAQPFSLVKLFAGNPVITYKTATYVTYRDIALTLDFYPSQIPGKRPCVIVIHGGSWSTGDSKQVPGLNSHLAKLGYNVAAINYRLSPEYHNPAAVDDTQAALNYLRKHADELKIDTNNFVLLGRSAGAQIALLAAYTLQDKDIKGVIDFYGPADMVWGYSVPASPLVMDSKAVMESYLGGTYKQVPQNYAASSPIEFVTRQSVPTLIIHGYNDVLVAYEHSRRLDEKLQQNGIKHYWLKLPWATHGFDYNLNGPGGQLSTYAVDGFLNAVTK